ncbi:MAG: hypothetical protein H5T83_01055 [Actinotalea sp.]|nr:hypothetical protein [Actinotalea sp.]
MDDGEHLIDEDDPFGGIEQFSEDSGRRLVEARDTVLHAIQEYVDELLVLRGGTSELTALFERNNALAQVVDGFTDAVWTHTGTLPLVSNSFEEDEEEDVDEPADPGDQLSVVSRWDLTVVDRDELLEAGRAAHRRLRPEETHEDAEVAVHDTAAALYALLHEAGEPWFDMPGVDVVAGTRAFIEPAETLAPPPEIDEPGYDLAEVLRPPDGRIPFTERW